ncbi:hypothetical protein CONPUDRAFT_154034 [Coniophora puteana RWD-64-598 SS2]|uniref:F-box domain-containing protein n=1 Tax=Coniophora puteana (strain RWD-64-598) TaxID=741705 RepID=A0A5M3MRX2_CONPW|nr:uncharacterized protein CONPUDRAFT_154034 [Coniophora puteana RWD-64-598 SS2]EIW81494.1 hypothetical protein CONPUDRAFT_154034 [Coniophora puteana RWD-64-598 SS2]
MSFSSRASISCLANETLLAIFGHIYQHTQDPFLRFPLGHPPRPILNVHSKTMFPYACAEVCRRWLAISAMDARFWRRVVIPIDAPYVTREVIQTVLEASRKNSKITVDICYRGAPLMDPSLEHVRIKLAMECLRPHLSRCSEFTLGGLYRSSTVLLARLFECIVLPEVVDLTLASSIVDTDERFALTVLDCPKLHRVDLDARSLADFVLSSAGWKLWKKCEPVLSATSYRPHGELYPLSPAFFGQAVITAHMRARVAFCIEDVEFSGLDASPSETSDPSPAGLPIFVVPKSDDGNNNNELSVCFSCMDGLSISRLLDHVVPSAKPDVSIAIMSSDLSSFSMKHRLGSRSRLLLSDVNDKASLLAILGNWDGPVLLLSYCPAFDDSVLRLLRKNKKFCPNLINFIVGGCPCTPRALSRMLRARHRAGRRVHGVDVTGDVMLPTEEELTLIEKSVDELCWYEAYRALRGGDGGEDDDEHEADSESETGQLFEGLGGLLPTFSLGDLGTL